MVRFAFGNQTAAARYPANPVRCRTAGMAAVFGSTQADRRQLGTGQLWDQRKEKRIKSDYFPKSEIEFKIMLCAVFLRENFHMV